MVWAGNGTPVSSYGKGTFSPSQKGKSHKFWAFKEKFTGNNVTIKFEEMF